MTKKNEQPERPTPDVTPRSEISVSDPSPTHEENVAAAEAAAAAQLEAHGLTPVTPVATVERITVGQFSRRRGRDAVVEVFASEEFRLQGTRKLPESEWAALFDAFQKKPR